MSHDHSHETNDTLAAKPCCGGAPPPVTQDSEGSCCSGEKAGETQINAGKAESCCGGISRTRDEQEHAHPGHHHGGVTPPSAAKYFCPMCPGVEASEPGDCPKCGMALERNPSWKAP